MWNRFAAWLTLLIDWETLEWWQGHLGRVSQDRRQVYSVVFGGHPSAVTSVTQCFFGSQIPVLIPRNLSVADVFSGDARVAKAWVFFNQSSKASNCTVDVFLSKRRLLSGTR